MDDQARQSAAERPPIAQTEGVQTHTETPNAESGAARWARAADLFERWRGGDYQAMDDLVRLMTPVLWHVIRAYGVSTTGVEDVMQTTWLGLLSKHHQIRDPRAVAGWLTLAARREAWRVLRAERRVVSVDNKLLESELPMEESAEESATQNGERDELWDAVAKLDSRCQRLIRAVAFDDRPDYARLAREMSMPIGSIGPTRGRCLSKLRAALGSHDEGSRDVT
jgi:RNA polymerase sigma factor (sigma-70 family)